MPANCFNRYFIRHKFSDMFKFFRRNNKNGKGDGPKPLRMVDIEGIPLSEGDIVESLRYELGKCRIVSGDGGMQYESLETGKKVHYLKMVDAATSFQKVKKLQAGELSQ